ncbi:hypothetical protein FQR65_LT18564 [Abscondita terminalis]|nr:hypothetical protein FQR65_LT18564 [Abscondita terminalis]
MSAIYLIIYKSENIELILPLNATLECLKKEIYRIIGLHPSQQDLAELNCFANDVLLISVISTDHSICLSHKKDVPEKISKVEQTPKQKPNHHINFQCVSLKEAITSCYSDSTSSDKMLLLYFHNKNDRLSQLSVRDLEFHQMMFDRLGDRDYDSFQPDEHTYLKDKIGFAKFGPPQMESGYDDAQNNSIDETYELIVNNNNRYAKWKNRVVVSFIYNCLEPLPQQKLEKAKQCSDYNPYTDITPVPVFVIRKCRGSEHPCRMFVDCDNRVYSSWDDYITTNKLNQYTMILPKHGRYDGDSNGTVLLETHATPSCSIQYTLAQHADSASSVAGIASGAVLLTAAVSAIPVAPLAISAAIVTGAGADNEYNKLEARGAYLNIIAGTLGLVGAGATGATARFATQGVHIGEGARVTVNVLNIANYDLGAAALANASYEMYDTWRESGTISPLSLLQLANTIINEAQTNALQDHEKSLRSNRHRKTFNKLLKETIRQNNGNVQAGRAEVISTISTMSNRDDVLAVLTRNNRRFNKNGVRFAAEGGRITLNG